MKSPVKLREVPYSYLRLARQVDTVREDLKPYYITDGTTLGLLNMHVLGSISQQW